MRVSVPTMPSAQPPEDLLQRLAGIAPRGFAPRRSSINQTLLQRLFVETHYLAFRRKPAQKILRRSLSHFQHPEPGCRRPQAQ